MRTTLAAAVFVFACNPATLFAQSAPAVPTPAATSVAPGHYSVEDTDIGTLLDDPAAKAILNKHVPGFTANDQIDMARGMTLKSIQQYSGDQMSDKVLSDIQSDFNKLPPKSK